MRTRRDPVPGTIQRDHDGPDPPRLPPPPWRRRLDDDVQLSHTTSNAATPPSAQMRSQKPRWRIGLRLRRNASNPPLPIVALLSWGTKMHHKWCLYGINLRL